MKGAFSENAQVFSQNLLNNIFPDHTYRHVSGGNPLEIPKLAYNDLVEFHKNTIIQVMLAYIPTDYLMQVKPSHFSTRSIYRIKAGLTTLTV